MIRASAYAKINLFLEITGRRSDGYHTLSTVFQTISLGDSLTFHPAGGLSLTCSDPSLPTDERNLVMKSAVRLRDVLKESQGAKIHLHKKVPMGAGLGGGSSDAAAVLRTLPRLWGRRIGVSVLHRLAVELGADVPFFLKGGLCRATGIGDKLKPLEARTKTWLVLVYPEFGVSTKEAYSRVRLPFNDPRRVDLKNLSLRLYNRFEELVFPDHPELPELKQELLRLGARAALMSGSGSSVFGLVRSKTAGEKVLAAIRPRYRQSWLVHTGPPFFTDGRSG